MSVCLSVCLSVLHTLLYRASSISLRHFDKDRNGKLEHHEFKSCLRSLGYDLALLESGETDPEFEAVLDQVDPNR